MTEISTTQRLEFPDPVRLRPGMYIGDVGVRGLHHLFREIIDNSVDEVLAGHCTKIEVVLGDDYVVTVSDNGRGIPVGISGDTGKTGIELAFTDIHAGRELNHYSHKVSGGLHGIGASCVNALSEWLQCVVRRDGRTYRIRFTRGLPVTPLEVTGDCAVDDHGTTVSWLADKTIFSHALTESDDLPYDGEIIARRCRELAYHLPAAKITFHDRLRDTPLKTFCFPNGVADYVRDMNRGRTVFPAKPILLSGMAGDTHVKVALQYSDSDTETVLGFANTIPTPADGTHITGFRHALTKAVNGLGTVRAKHRGEIVRRGLTAVVSVLLPDPKFNPSDRTRLDSPEVEGVVFSVVYAGLKKQWTEYPDQRLGILERLTRPTD